LGTPYTFCVTIPDFQESVKIKNFPPTTVRTEAVDEIEAQNGDFPAKIRYVSQKMDVFTYQNIVQQS